MFKDTGDAVDWLLFGLTAFLCLVVVLRGVWKV